MKTILNKTLFFFSLAVAIITGSCNEFKDSTDYSSFAESVKDLSGEWRIISVVRNGQDIGRLMDVSNFRLHLKPDGTYTIETDLPFLVRTAGEWSTDHPQFPFTLTFKESATNNTVRTDMVYPIVNGVRQIRLSFSTGCFRNTYTYSFISDNF